MNSLPTIRRRNLDAMYASYANAVRAVALQELYQHHYICIEAMPGAPASLASLNAVPKGFLGCGYRFPVETAHSDKTVFDNPTDALLFQAWHNLTHIDLQAPFTLAGEIAVYEAQSQLLRQPEHRRILYIEIVRRTEHLYRCGFFPGDQRGFCDNELDTAWGSTTSSWVPPGGPAVDDLAPGTVITLRPYGTIRYMVLSRENPLCDALDTSIGTPVATLTATGKVLYPFILHDAMAFYPL